MFCDVCVFVMCVCFRASVEGDACFVTCVCFRASVEGDACFVTCVCLCRVFQSLS